MFKVQILKNGSAPFHFRVSADKLDLNEETNGSNFEGDVEVNGELTDGGKLFNVKGTIKYRKSFICDRCLEPSSEECLTEFDEELDKSNAEGDMIDLTDVIRDTLIASQPIQNLCKEDCKGLCPICGKNLNEGECSCDRFVADPRLEALKNLLVD